MGALEVYANIGQPQGKIYIVKLFSKRSSGVWPNINAVRDRAFKAMEEAADPNILLTNLGGKYESKGTALPSMAVSRKI